MTELVKLLPRPAAIRSFQHRPGKSKNGCRSATYPEERGQQPQMDRRVSGSTGGSGIQGDRGLVAEPTAPGLKKARTRSLNANIRRTPHREAQGFILALRRDALKSAPGIAEAADGVIDAVAAALPNIRRVVFDRGWSEKRLFAVIAKTRSTTRTA